MKSWTLIQGECLPALHAMADESIDAVINYGEGLEQTLIFRCEIEAPSSFEGSVVTHELSERPLPVPVYA